VGEEWARNGRGGVSRSSSRQRRIFSVAVLLIWMQQLHLNSIKCNKTKDQISLLLLRSLFPTCCKLQGGEWRLGMGPFQSQKQIQLQKDRSA